MFPDAKTEHLFIVGAGFSHHAGLPLTANFTELLLDVDDLRAGGPSDLQVKLLKKFVSDTFKHSAPKYWPYLEDIFTCIDLSANTGHHLGPIFSPAILRTVRRALIVRIIRMLRSAYAQGRDNAGSRWKVLEKFFALVNPDSCAFLSMNWDTVIESGLTKIKGISQFDYGCDAVYGNLLKSEVQIPPLRSVGKIQVLKPHGSTNWLYCDACRQLFWFSPGQTDRIAAQLFKPSDWEVVKAVTGESYSHPSVARKCPSCDAEALGTRFATFSYRKALEFPMHGSSWRTAERLLREAVTWSFIGYSLPAADYEFKYLLKRVQLSRKTRPEIVLITGGAKGAAEQTRKNYQKFFGPRLKANSANVFVKGLSSTAIGRLQGLGALSS